MNGKEAMRVKINSSHLSSHGYQEHQLFMHLTNHSWAMQRCDRLIVLWKARKTEKWSQLKSRKPHESLKKKQGG